MRFTPKMDNLNRSKSQTLYVNMSGVNPNINPREFTNSLLVDSLLTKRENKMSLSIKASEYSKVLNNHLNSVSSALTGAGITDKKIVGNAMKQAESQFRTDYKATGGKHEDFFSIECRLQLDKVNAEIKKLNALNPTGKTGMSVEVSTICKKA